MSKLHEAKHHVNVRLDIAELDKKISSFFSHQDPNMVEWFVKMVEERKKNNDSSKEKKNW